jgi:transcriptional regulator with XRE-family HTH domain
MKSQALKELGRRIAAYRRIAGMTQEQLAEKLRVTPETISRFERGVIAPSFERLEMLAAAFRVTLRDLFDFQARTPAAPHKTAKNQALDALVRILRNRSVDEVRQIGMILRRVLAYADARAGVVRTRKGRRV